MTPIDASPGGVTLVERAAVPEAARAILAATAAADVTFRTAAGLGDVVIALGGAIKRDPLRATVAFGAWRTHAMALYARLCRAARLGTSSPVGVAFAHAGPTLVLVLVAADDSWRVGVVAEQQGPGRGADVAFGLEPVAPPGVLLDQPPAPPAGRPRLTLLRGGR